MRRSYQRVTCDTVDDVITGTIRQDSCVYHLGLQPDHGQLDLFLTIFYIKVPRLGCEVIMQHSVLTIQYSTVKKKKEKRQIIEPQHFYITKRL